MNKFCVIIIFIFVLPVCHAATIVNNCCNADTTIEGWDTPLCKGCKVTPYTAAQFIFPGSDFNDEGDFVLKQEKILRIPGTTKERSILPAGTKLNNPVSYKVKSGNRDYYLLLCDGIRPEGYSDRVNNEEVAVLGVFPDGSVEPTDIAEVKSDKLTFIGERPFLKIGSDDGFTIINHHANAGQAYYNISLYHIKDGRLRRIAEEFTLTQSSGCDKSFKEELHWIVSEKEIVNGYPKITAEIDLIRSPAEFLDGCEKRSSTKKDKYIDIYTWDIQKAKYINSGGNIKSLDKWNEKHF